MIRNKVFKKSILVLLTVACYLLLATSLTLAQEPNYDRINDIARNLNCPTCAGLNLADCRTQTCAQWRGQIGDLVQEGYSDQEVLDFFTKRYGEQVLQAPPKHGFTLILWVLPFIAILAAGGWLVYALRNWTGPKAISVRAAASPANPARVVTTPPESTDDYLQQVDRDLGLDQT
jgi:cytochrome c-type biogenesis protein CcmH